ncbi:MAG: hypothetical protein CW341_08120 [Bacteroidetes bacterium]|nr:hypothetical protein [Bacteroidota bacterium]
MLTEIEHLLETKTAGKKSHVFYTQWQVAKDYVPQVLNTISQVFPHYSLHDRTHSETIIYNIGRIVGMKTLEKMSSIDLWMILSAAYYHDMGMAVFSNEKISSFQDKDFVGFLKTCQTEDSSPLHDYAICFEIKEEKVYYKNDFLSAKNYDAARFLLAEYFRKKHGERANDSVSSDMSINLPGSPIPKRIINVLGNICHAHTQSFDKVMELPFCEAGIDHEDCHPRYIACLLRLGDLLDIDSNRFSEVLLQTLPSIPIDSIWHKEKHMAIKHLQINEIKIEATAECDEYDVADVTNRWFSLIDTEMYNQMKNWNDIVPDTSYGFPPTLGKMEVLLKGYDTINGKDRPSFKIDSTKAIELLQGAGLYNEPHQCIRELLQNSVDATILRVFAESEENGIPISDRDDFYKRCTTFPIKISITKEKIEHDKIDWSIKISDCGIGMSKKDLMFLTTTGSSNKNIEKRKIVERMPEWMRPSGTFGIGFQSVFLLTDSVKIKTKKLNKEEVLNVSLYNPAGKKEGSVLLQTLLNEHKSFGTDLEFNIVRKSIPDRWTVAIKPSMATRVISSYDFVNDDSMDIDIAKIIDEINQFAETSYVPIHIKLDDQDEVVLNSGGRKTFKYFDEETGLELSISSSKNNSRIYYRNQIVSKGRLALNYLSFQVNILSGDAKDILTLNRDDIQSKFNKTLCEKVMKTAIGFLKTYYDELDEELKKQASMFLNYYLSDDERRLNFGGASLDDWKRLVVGDNPSKSMEDILAYDSIIFKKDTYHSREIQLKQLDDNTLEIIVDPHNSELLTFITYKFGNQKLRYYTKESEKGKVAYIELSKGNNEVIIDDWEVWFNQYLSHDHYSRNLMPCVEKYKVLHVKERVVIWGCQDFTFSSVNQNYPKMVCPYVRFSEEGDSYYWPKKLKLSITDKLYQFVYDNRFDESVTLEQIKEGYQNFLDDTKQYVQNLLEETD